MSLVVFVPAGRPVVSFTHTRCLNTFKLWIRRWQGRQGRGTVAEGPWQFWYCNVRSVRTARVWSCTCLIGSAALVSKRHWRVRDIFSTSARLFCSRDIVIRLPVTAMVRAARAAGHRNQTLKRGKPMDMRAHTTPPKTEVGWSKKVKAWVTRVWKM